jgi:phosphoribosylformimino-5-aminoimidazole carboxamide ribotide isomerase
MGLGLMIDAGIRSVESARTVLEAGAESVVAGLETSRGPEQLQALCREFGAERVIFSLDMHNGKPLGATAAWESSDPFEIAARAVAAGAARLIVLDLAAVGVGQGISTESLCRRLLERFPCLRLITGGGIRGIEDVRRLQPLGLEGVLVASALHDGRLTSELLASLRMREGAGERERRGTVENS